MKKMNRHIWQAQNGKVRSVRLITTASMHARMIGPPTGDWGSPPFVVREKLKSRYVVWRHHRRATDYDEEDE
jgi:hypothetical protein